MESDSKAAISALVVIIGALGLPRLWSVLSQWLGISAKHDQSVLSEAVKQRQEWQKWITDLRAEVHDLCAKLEAKDEQIVNLQRENALCSANQVILSRQVDDLTRRLADMEERYYGRSDHRDSDIGHDGDGREHLGPVGSD